MEKENPYGHTPHRVLTLPHIGCPSPKLCHVAASSPIGSCRPQPPHQSGGQMWTRALCHQFIMPSVILSHPSVSFRVSDENKELKHNLTISSKMQTIVFMQSAIISAANMNSSKCWAQHSSLDSLSLALRLEGRARRNRPHSHSPCLLCIFSTPGGPNPQSWRSDHGRNFSSQISDCFQGVVATVRMPIEHWWVGRNGKWYS